MRVFFVSFLMSLCLAGASVAQTSGLQTLNTGNDARGWEAVGRLDIEGKGFCTATLIAPDLVLTAAHCLYQTSGGDQVDIENIEFLAGLRNGRPAATRGVRKVVIHPNYPNQPASMENSVRYDLALLQLDSPIRSSAIEPFEISNTSISGVQVGVVSYAQDRSETPALQEVCRVLGEQQGTVVMTCDIDFGASGAPVFRLEAGVPRLVSVFSAMAEVDGQRVALGMDLAQPLETLRRAMVATGPVFATPPSTARVTRPGERADTGALFLHP